MNTGLPPSLIIDRVYKQPFQVVFWQASRPFCLNISMIRVFAVLLPAAFQISSRETLCNTIIRKIRLIL